MKATTSYGVCALCGERATKAKMAAHLKTCAPTYDKTPSEPVFQLRVEAGDLPMFWIDLEAKALATLADLDRFLRKTWLECCGHMSDFRVGGIAYTAASDGREPGERSMNIALADVVGGGAKRLAYQYDFGSTTELTLLVVGAREGGLGRKKLRVLARNEPLDWPCAVCGGSTELICAFCRDDQAPFVCERHALEHPCGDEGLLPVVNSPRMGVCGYTGPG